MTRIGGKMNGKVCTIATIGLSYIELLQEQNMEILWVFGIGFSEDHASHVLEKSVDLDAMQSLVESKGKSRRYRIIGHIANKYIQNSFHSATIEHAQFVMKMHCVKQREPNGTAESRHCIEYDFTLCASQNHIYVNNIIN